MILRLFLRWGSKLFHFSDHISISSRSPEYVCPSFRYLDSNNFWKTQMRFLFSTNPPWCSMLVDAVHSEATSCLWLLQLVLFVPSVCMSFCFNQLPLSSDQSLPLWFSSTESTCNARDTPTIPELGRSFEGGNGNPLQFSCLENLTDRRAWQPTVLGVAKSQMWLRDSTHNTPNDQSLIFNKVLRGTWGKIWIYIQSNLHLLFKMLIFFFRMSSNPVQTWSWNAFFTWYSLDNTEAF